jgi:hypothetical protein
MSHDMHAVAPMTETTKREPTPFARPEALCPLCGTRMEIESPRHCPTWCCPDEDCNARMRWCWCCEEWKAEDEVRGPNHVCVRCDEIYRDGSKPRVRR